VTCTIEQSVDTTKTCAGATCVDSTTDKAACCVDNILESIAPKSISAGGTSTITFAGTMAVNDMVSFVVEGVSCTTSDIVVTDKKAAVKDLVVGTYDVCYQLAAGSASVKQAGLKLTVVDATLSNFVTEISLNPSEAEVGTAVTVSMTTATAIVAESFVAFTTKTDCTEAEPDLPVVVVEKTVVFTPTDAGTHIMCYRNMGGNDAVKQTGIELSVNAKSSQTSGVSRVPVCWMSGLAVVLSLHLASAHRL